MQRLCAVRPLSRQIEELSAAGSTGDCRAAQRAKWRVIGLEDGKLGDPGLVDLTAYRALAQVSGERFDFGQFRHVSILPDLASGRPACRYRPVATRGQGLRPAARSMTA